jgi:hypothetical protein
MSFESAVLDAVAAGYEVTFRPAHITIPAVAVDIRYRGTHTVSRASGTVSKAALLDARDSGFFTYFLRRLILQMDVERPHLTELT